ncbi:MAG: UDP-glucose/GDP-mannose dehydrogenase family protein [Candidatus Omnitrophota bacterium]|nr:MAG: UDP-glucose/GDP-mannose dehydrogenase family protein [Candidatus Omnitrophota bacterium]
MDICIVGAGHVGLVTGACFAELGNQVVCVDNDSAKIAGLKKSIMPFYEPGLKEMVVKNAKEKRLSFTTSLKGAVKKSLIIFIAVGTPPKENGEADLTDIERVAQNIARFIPSYRLIVEKSTVPVETGRWVEHTIRVNIRGRKKFDVASNPEFLREGAGIEDFMRPDRIVLGVKSKRARDILTELYKPLQAPIIITDIKSAELIKHASNSFLATKISFINAIANICESVGADVAKVAEGLGTDRRIGNKFLNAGCGYGGFCFPKDIEAFIRIAEKKGYDFQLLKAVKEINESQKSLMLKKIEDALWNLKDKTIGVLGLSFKPGTDDLRFAPSIDIIRKLQLEGANICAFDPQAMKGARSIFKDIKFCNDVYEAARGADCLLVLTEWNEFKEIDFKKIKKLLKQPVIIDGRNIYDPEKMKKMRFRYFAVGRS